MTYVSDVNGPTLYAAGDPNAYQRLVDAANLSSQDDDLLNDAELEKFMETLVPGDISPDQTARLIEIYGGGGVVSKQTIIEQMTADGFLQANPAEGGVSWSYNWDNIDGGLISDALFRVMGLDPAGTMTAEEFDEATDRLFGDTEGVNPENAEFLTRMFGAGGRLNREQLAGIFERNDIHVEGVVTEDYVRIFVNASIDTAAFADQTQAAGYIMSFDENGDGILSRDEFRAAIESRLADGTETNDQLTDDYMAFYGVNDADKQRVMLASGVEAMLADTSLAIAPRGPDGAQGFGINLNITPIERVVRGASLDDDMLNHNELAVLLERLGLGGRDPAQMDFLINVYGNGDVVSVDTIMGQMQQDGFLTLNPNLAAPSALNWDNIDGALIAAAVFRAEGVDPAVPGATMNADQFNAGVDRLFGDTEGQSLADATQQIAIFGTNGTVTVAEMGAAFDDAMIHIDGVAGEGYVRIAAHSTVAADGSTVADHHHYSWWNTIIRDVEGGAKAFVAEISSLTGLAEEFIADVFNGTISMEEAIAKDGIKIVEAIVDGVERGEERAIALLDKIGSAIINGLEGLTDEAKLLVGKMVEAAKTGGEEIAVRSLMILSGMDHAKATEVLESMATQGSFVEFLNGLTYDSISELDPNFEQMAAGVRERADAFLATYATDPTARATLEADGYSFDSSNRLMRDGRVLSEADEQDTINRHWRFDAALEVNLGATGVENKVGGKSVFEFNGLQFRVFYAYRGTNAAGDPVHELRFRVLDEAGIAMGSKSGGFDAGLVTVHDFILQFNGDDKVALKYNSTLAVIGELNGGIGGLTEGAKMLARMAGWDAPAAPDEVVANLNRFDSEVGLGYGLTTSYNLSEMGSDWWQPFLSEVAGAVVGTAIAGLDLVGVAAATEGTATALELKYAGTALHVGAMLGGFGADLIFAGLNHREAEVTVSHGFFVWGALRVAPASPDKFNPFPSGLGGPFDEQERLRGQVNWSTDDMVAY